MPYNFGFRTLHRNRNRNRTEAKITSFSLRLWWVQILQANPDYILDINFCRFRFRFRFRFRCVRFSKGGIYREENDNGLIGLSHSKTPTKKGMHISIPKQRRSTATWLPFKSDEGSESWLTRSVSSSFTKTNTGSKGKAPFSGKAGKRFRDHNSYLKHASKVDRRGSLGHIEWKPKPNACRMDASKTNRFESPGSIYRG